MESPLATRIRWLFDSQNGPRSAFLPRWIFLRALAAIYFSAFCALFFQIRGLIGPTGISPAGPYLEAVARSLGHSRIWYAPTLFWFSSGSHMLMAVVCLGLAASATAFFNLWPRLSFLLCFVCFLSFVSSAGVFSEYQSDGMLLEAGFIALFFAPGGLRPAFALNRPPIRASLFLLQWEWFRIYFESGMVKLLSGDPEWRHLTAMDDYYQNGPLPTWIGWYVQHLPHRFHVASALGTLIMELGVVLLLFLPRRLRLLCFCIVTPWEIGVILTANYAFLNYLVLSLGFLLLDDRALLWLLPAPIAARLRQPMDESPAPHLNPAPAAEPRLQRHLRAARLALSAVMLLWIAYDTTAEMIGMPLGGIPGLDAPVTALEPFRIANQYGLFAVMTRGRYEIEFQGSMDGQSWTPYPFRYKPQALDEAPGIYAPYQPRFDWNLWFASLGDWRQNQMVPVTEVRLLQNDAAVLQLFRSNPFAPSPPRFVRAVLWQYWFTSRAEKKQTGNWWRRSLMGLYAPEITLAPAGNITVVEWPQPLPPHN